MIAPGPEKAPGGWRVAGTITKEIRGDRKVQHFDRADASPDREVIVAMTIEKAKRIIDEQGDRLFTHEAARLLISRSRVRVPDSPSGPPPSAGSAVVRAIGAGVFHPIVGWRRKKCPYRSRRSA